VATRSINLGSKASQTVFAEIVGVSQQAIALKVKEEVLTRDGTYAEWFVLYTDRLRQEAAGRSGEAQGRLTEARIEESRENSAEKKQRRLIAARLLLQRADVEHILLELPALVRQQMMTTAEAMQEKLESKYSIEMTDDDIKEPVRTALGHVADRAVKLVESLDSDQG